METILEFNSLFVAKLFMHGFWAMAAAVPQQVQLKQANALLETVLNQWRETDLATSLKLRI